ncbi:hypothetical protein K438DRAFT_1909489 [Mycena galopus ATCC 62051]|nr:hypothetical protein K438DRAFT_1909489 [Mycena galopus ATCC 62051]
MSLPLPSGHVLEPTDITFVERTSESSGSSTVRTRGGSEETAIPPVDEKDRRDRPPKVFVPPKNEHRCLILCFDGTCDQVDAKNSNVVQLVSAMKKDDPKKQMVYYQSGIGTYTSLKVVNPLTTKISLILDAAVAWNLDAHIMAGYEFLVQNYTPGDRICMFGFSRGAYIARCLAGMIHEVGLLPVGNHQQIPFAYRIYARRDLKESKEFKTALSNDVQIEFVGVWDTVNSVGLTPKQLPFTRSNNSIRTFRHAMSLDEHRAKFQPNPWHNHNNKEKELGTHTPPVAPTLQYKPPQPEFTLPVAKIKTHFTTVTQSDDEDDKEPKACRETDVAEVWFAGCHCDVGGGGSVANETPHSLARIPLRWMIRECFKANTGIIFEAQRLQEFGLDLVTLHPPFRRPLPLPIDIRGTEEEEDLKDLLQPIYDELQLKPFWWILEILPLPFRSPKSDTKGTIKFRYVFSVSQAANLNFGRARHIPHQRPHDPQYDVEEKSVVNLKVHRSVKSRKEPHDAKGRPYYVNRARFPIEPEWVD